jgi:hypothetical protein
VHGNVVLKKWLFFVGLSTRRREDWGDAAKLDATIKAQNEREARNAKVQGEREARNARRGTRGAEREARNAKVQGEREARNARRGCEAASRRAAAGGYDDRGLRRPWRAQLTAAPVVSRRSSARRRPFRRC